MPENYEDSVMTGSDVNMEPIYNRHYVIIDAQGCIMDGWSDGPQPHRGATDAVCINDQGDYQFRLFPDGEENPSLYTADGIPLYRWDGEQVIPRTEEEIAADLAAIPDPPPTPQEQLRADVDFLAALQGVML